MQNKICPLIMDCPPTACPGKCVDNRCFLALLEERFASRPGPRFEAEGDAGKEDEDHG